jgi:L,D-peptidoglycan transpeptidase YkuD (ErfK/YbiS/YcfS/YnhG family)
LASPIAAAFLFAATGSAFAQSCPQPLASATRLVLVTTDGMATATARMQRFERAAPGAVWQPAGGPQSALIGRNGMAWAQTFRSLAKAGEPIKVDGDKRAPAGIYRIGSSFGFGASSRPGYLRVQAGTVCVDDAASPAYNTISSRAKVGVAVHGENMWRIAAYRHGLLVDYPTDRLARAGSCIFIHIRMPGAAGTAGCVAIAEPDMIALQDFAEPGAVLAILPEVARSRLSGCLPAVN